ncbi:MAG: tetratricopeptide repeat protein [Candidatus Hydrogenedentota bacterium]
MISAHDVRRSAFAAAVTAAHLCSCAREDLTKTARDLFAACSARTTDVQAALDVGDSQRAQALGDEAKSLLARSRAAFEGSGIKTSDVPQDLATYGDILTRMGDVDLAANVYRRAAERAPQSPTLWLNLGRALRATGPKYWEEALVAMRSCIRLTNDPALVAAAHEDAGDLLLLMNHASLAEQDFREALSFVPNAPRAKIGLAASLIHRGRVREGMTEIEALGPLSPESTGIAMEYVSRAVQDFFDAQLYVPDTAADHLALAKALVLAGRRGECALAVERAAALDPDNTIAWNLLGSVSREAGDIVRARTAFTKSLELDPDQSRTREALDALNAAAP